MKTTIKIYCILILVLISLLSESCSLKSERLKQREGQVTLNEAEKKRETEKIERQRNETFNDSVTLIIKNTCPSAFDFDTVEYRFTYFFQSLLEKSSNLIFIKEARIENIEKFKDTYIVHVSSYSPQMFGKFKLSQSLSKRILTELESNDYNEDCCLIVKINKLIPVNSEIVAQIDKFSLTPEEEDYVTESDVRDYVHLSFDSSLDVGYLLSGEILDYALLK